LLQLPGERVLAPPASDDQDFHRDLLRAALPIPAAPTSRVKIWSQATDFAAGLGIARRESGGVSSFFQGKNIAPFQPISFLRAVTLRLHVLRHSIREPDG
jgi:hypothetical protein